MIKTHKQYKNHAYILHHAQLALLQHQSFGNPHEAHVVLSHRDQSLSVVEITLSIALTCCVGANKTCQHKISEIARWEVVRRADIPRSLQFCSMYFIRRFRRKNSTAPQTKYAQSASIVTDERDGSNPALLTSTSPCF